MTLQQLKYIIALEEYRHFARAAEVCNVSQPGLTIQLKNLEEEIGIRLFDRSKVPLKPTALGMEIIEKAKRILREADEIRDFIIHSKDTLQGEVRLGVISTLSPYLVPLFISAVKATLPEMHFSIKESHTLQLMQDLETGVLDVALMATPTGRTGLREYPVFNEPFVAYLYPSHPMAGQEFYEMLPEDRQELLLLQNEYCYNAQLLDICAIEGDRKIKGQFTYEISSIETLKNMVRADLGFAIVPELSIGYEVDHKLYKSFADPKPVREISLVVAASFSRKLLLEKMSETLWSCLPESLKKEFSYRKIQWNDSPYFVKSTKGF